MKKFLRFAVFGLLAACGSARYAPPANLENACRIVDERPEYLRAMKATERRWGVPVAVQMATIYQESKFVGNAKTPIRYTLGVIPMGRQSSAYGYAQALDGTWEEYLEQAGRWRAKRQKISDATDFIGWYMDGTTRQLGISKYDARNQYLAYHEGRAGFRRGSYRSKGWLINVADRLARRADRYNMQLIACGKV